MRYKTPSRTGSGFLASVSFFFAALARTAAHVAGIVGATGIGFLLVPFMAIFAIVGLATRGLRNRAIQKQRKQIAAMIVAAIETGESCPPFALYLRPFATDQKMAGADGRDVVAALNPLDVSFGRRAEDRELQEVLANALAPDISLVSISSKPKGLGAGTVKSTEEGWHHQVSYLMNHCSVVFVVPGSQEGTIWEIQALAQRGLLPKTIFINPPKTAKFKVAKHLQAAKAALASVDLQIPDRPGLLYGLGADGRTMTFEHRFGRVPSPRKLRKWISGSCVLALR